VRDRSIAVLGAGGWGTALSVILAHAGRSVRLWIREEDLVARMIDRRDNPVFLPGVPIPPGVLPTGDLAQALDGVEMLLAVVPSPFARRVYEHARGLIPAGIPVVIATKGVEEGTLALPGEVAREVLGAERPLAFLSGPSFAPEVARGLPTAVVAASTDSILAARVQDLFSGSHLRVYTNADPVGVQVAGALKNVIAIAAGVVDGSAMGRSAVAALITRGLAEMRRLGVALGGKPSTFSGLAGLGDLVLTATGDLSRNRRVGQALGRGERLRDILARTPAVAEGVSTTRSSRELAHRREIEMPIVEEVYRLLYEDGSPHDAVARLMGRRVKAEEGAEAESIE